MRLLLLLIPPCALNMVSGFLLPSRPRLLTHFGNSRSNFALFSKRFEIYRLRRQREILDSFEYIFTRQRGLPIGNNISPELIHGISVLEVRLNSDCTHAVISILASGDLFQQRQCFSWVNRNVKRLRYLMAQMLKHRKNVPTIEFKPYDLDSKDDIKQRLQDIKEDNIDTTAGTGTASGGSGSTSSSSSGSNEEENMMLIECC